jgi:RNA polymerase sigma factor (sigma-70 family)
VSISPPLKGLIEAGASAASAVSSSALGPEAFTRAFESYFDPIYRYLSRRAGRRAAEELTAETFAQCFKARATYDPERGTTRAWMFGVASNVASAHSRTQLRRDAGRVHLSGNEGGDLSDRVVDRVGDIARVDAALAGIEPGMRDVLLLVGGFDLSYKEAADALDVPIGTIRSRYSRGKHQFTAALRKIDNAAHEDDGAVT